MATRITALDSNGFVDPGAASYTTEQAMKVTMTPVMETGDDIAIKNAAGNLAVYAKHPDIVKYGTVSLDMGIPEPAIEQLCTGGVLLSSSASALGEPTSPTVVGQITQGTLAAATYGYRFTNVNAFGESKATNETTGSVASGSAGMVVATAVPATGAYGVRVYGRALGLEQLLGFIPNVGKQKAKELAAKAVKANTPTLIKVVALTKSIPTGTTFQIAGDTNSPKITFKTTGFGAEGATEIQVESPVEQVTLISEGEIVPVFVDTGATTPSGNIPSADTTAGPGTSGYQDPALGTVANSNGVSIEIFTEAIVGGTRASSNPYWWIVLPKVTGMHAMPKEATNANMATVMEGQAFQNPNWGTGPQETWPYDSTKWRQRTRCGASVVPKASLTNVPAV
ncbi:MAG TPA: hypothetical protein VGN13_12465 [Solirubrobacteraceae bacterium]